MKKKQRKAVVKIALSAMLAIIVYCIIRFVPVVSPWQRALLYLLPYAAVGGDVVTGACKNLVGGRVFDEKFLMTLATVGAFCTGQFPEAVAVMLFYQVGELFQSVAVEKSRKSIAELMNIRPDTAVVLRGGEEYTVSPDEVEVGETIVVRAGEKVPLDGIIVKGATSVDCSGLTGESMPVEKTENDSVLSGSVNLTGVIEIRTTSIFAESTASKILELVENSATKKAKCENFITKFARYYTPSVVICALLLAVVPPLFAGINSAAVWSEWIMRAMVFLVVSCPCALVISVPLSFFGGIGCASKRGVLIKGSNYLEALAKVGTVVFDKTGTLTQGSFTVTAIHPETLTERELLKIAALAESRSTHPVAESIAKAYDEYAPIEKNHAVEIRELAGLGVEAVIDGKKVYVGNGKLMDKVGAKRRDCHIAGTIVHLAYKDEYLGHIVINDTLKPDARRAIDDLKQTGVRKIVMLTGDSEKVAKSVCGELGFDEAYADLLPSDKVRILETMLDDKSKVAFCGDGINDAPVLSRADIGIAMGAIGSDAAIEAADVVIMDDKPTKIAEAVRVSKKTMKIVYQNIIFAIGVKLAVLFAGAFGLANMWIAVFADVGVAVIAILNAMRALKNPLSRKNHD